MARRGGGSCENSDFSSPASRRRGPSRRSSTLPSETDVAPLLLSLEVAGLATLVAAIVGLALAALLALGRFPGRDILDVVITAPLVLPPTVLGYYLLVALGRHSALGGVFERITGSSIVFTRTGAV